MKEIILVRHAQSYANIRDFAAFGNIDSPLTEKGVAQATALNGIFKASFGIAPESNTQSVAVSEYTRAQQTAHYAGFHKTEALSLINESDVDRDILSGTDVIAKHTQDRWVPDETRKRAAELFDRIKDEDLTYDIYFTHGMFIAGFLLECSARLGEVPPPFTDKRGYVPLQASVIKLEI